MNPSSLNDPIADIIRLIVGGIKTKKRKSVQIKMHDQLSINFTTQTDKMSEKQIKFIHFNWGTLNKNNSNLFRKF